MNCGAPMRWAPTKRLRLPPPVLLLLLLNSSLCAALDVNVIVRYGDKDEDGGRTIVGRACQAGEFDRDNDGALGGGKGEGEAPATHIRRRPFRAPRGACANFVGALIARSRKGIGRDGQATGGALFAAEPEPQCRGSSQLYAAPLPRCWMQAYA
jgi:hypothetical protein